MTSAVSRRARVARLSARTAMAASHTYGVHARGRRRWWRTRSSRSRALIAPRYREPPDEGYVVAHTRGDALASTARGEAVAGGAPPAETDRPVDPDAVDLVTVLVPARNEEASIGDALDSIVGQTYPWLQIVVVDDGSTD